MTSQMTNPDQVRGFFQLLAVDLEDKHGYGRAFKDMHRQSLMYIAEKRRDYHGPAYVEQIENNAIYLGEMTNTVCQAMATFLVDGKPRLKLDQIRMYFIELRRPAMTAALCHQEYVRNGCTGCIVHAHHHRWEPVFRLRRSGDTAKYLEEIEFQCIVFQMRFLMGQAFLGIILQNNQWAKMAKKMPLGVVQEILSVELSSRASLWNGQSILVQNPMFDEKSKTIGTGEFDATKNPTWLDLWGDEYRKIVNSM